MPEIKVTETEVNECLSALTRIQMTLPPGTCVTELSKIQSVLMNVGNSLSKNTEVEKVGEAARKGFYGK